MNLRLHHPSIVVIAAWAVLGLGAGCGPMIELEEGSETGDADSTTTTNPLPPPPPGTTTVPPPGDTTGSADDTGSNFVGADDGFRDEPCDLFEQNCPLGEKCMPWANDGGNSWNATRCVPIVDDPDAVGEPCAVEGGPTSGLDTCGLGAMCWDVDPETGEGTCTAMCIGSPEEPVCMDPNDWCSISGDGAITLCFPWCDPLAQDCPEGQACYGVNDVFSCVPDAGGDTGAPGDACEYINVCDPGNFCANADAVPDCPGNVGCCSPFCDLTDPVPSCLPGQECVPWYGENPVPTGANEDVGACVVPR